MLYIRCEQIKGYFNIAKAKTFKYRFYTQNRIFSFKSKNCSKVNSPDTKRKNVNYKAL